MSLPSLSHCSSDGLAPFACVDYLHLLCLSGVLLGVLGHMSL